MADSAHITRIKHLEPEIKKYHCKTSTFDLCKMGESLKCTGWSKSLLTRQHYALLFVSIHLSGVMSFQVLDPSVILRPPQLPQKRRNNNIQKYHPFLVLSAKSPPSSQFDLEAIEAFEASLYSETTPDENEGDRNDEEEEIPYETITYTVTETLNSKRIDAALSSLEPKFSRSYFGTLVTDGCVYLNDEIISRKSQKVKDGDVLRVEYPPSEEPTDILAQNIPLRILFEDEYMIVVNKAAGMVVHPAPGNWDGTLVNAVKYYLENDTPFKKTDTVFDDDDSDDDSRTLRPGVVHRLDKGTTGVIIVAKTRDALVQLSSSFKKRTVNKTYVAVTVGNPGTKVMIDNLIGRHPIQRQKMRVVPDPSPRQMNRIVPRVNVPGSVKGRRAISFVDTLASVENLSFVQVKIRTGRTHQIRVHLSHRRTPVYGDEVYGVADWNKRLEKKYGLKRPLLHASRLELDHPVTGERLVFVAEMDENMLNVVEDIWPNGRLARPDLFGSKG